MGITNNFEGVSLYFSKKFLYHYLFVFRFGEKIEITYLTDLLAFNDPVHCMNFLEESRKINLETKK